MPTKRASIMSDSLCAMMAWCFHAPSAEFDLDADLRMTREQQQQRRKVPWFLGGSKDAQSIRVTSALNKSGSLGLTARQDSMELQDVSAPNMQPAANAPIVPPNALPPRWVLDDTVAACAQCQQAFDLLTRKHHCRACGLVFCANCTATMERVVKYGFIDPVRCCLNCAIEARAENELYETHLPLLEKGDVFLKRGLLMRRLVEVKFVRDKLFFQYQTIDPELRVASGEIKAFPLDAIVDVRTSEVMSNGQSSAGFSIVVGNDEHRLDAATFQLRKEWMTAIQCLRDIRAAQLTRERERQALKASEEHDEMRQIAMNLQKSEERKASFHQERLRKRAEQRESLRAKYNLQAATTAS